MNQANQTLKDRQLRAAGSALRVGPLLLAVVLGVAAWGTQALAFHTLLQALTITLLLQVVTFIFALAVLAGALSFIPSGFGVIDARLFVVLS